MKFDQAIIKKKSLDFISFVDNGLTYTIFVTPEKEEDFKLYISKIRGSFKRLKDEDAKRFSSNGEFTLYGLWSDRANISFKKID